MWEYVQLTTGSPNLDVAFSGRGSVFVDSSGTIDIYIISGGGTSAKTVSTSPIYQINGSTQISADLPSGAYRLALNGAGPANVYYNTQSVDTK